LRQFFVVGAEVVQLGGLLAISSRAGVRRCIAARWWRPCRRQWRAAILSLVIAISFIRGRRRWRGCGPQPMRPGYRGARRPGADGGLAVQDFGQGNRRNAQPPAPKKLRNFSKARSTRLRAPSSLTPRASPTRGKVGVQSREHDGIPAAALRRPMASRVSGAS